MKKETCPAAPGEERLLTAAELARRLGVSVHTIYRLTGREGGLRGYKVGRLTRYRPGEVEAFLEAGRVEAPEEPAPFGGRSFHYTPGMKVVKLER